MLKKLYGESKHVTSSDISPYAIASHGLWERVYGVQLDASFECRSYEIPVEAASFDLLFAFQAAHHFVAHGRTLREINRVLMPGGVCLYLHEPTCSRLLHPVARYRVNQKGMPVPEDVLIQARILALGRAAGLRASSVFDLSVAKRGPVELLYYSVLRAVPLIRYVLPCTRDFVFEKPLRPEH